MLGAIIGDIVGSVHQAGRRRAKESGPLFHPAASYTGDTICTLAVADALVNGRHPAFTLKEWGLRFRNDTAWGRHFASWLRNASIQPYGSYGAGAALRVGPAGLMARDVDEAIALAYYVSGVTHDHPEGMKGAAAIAVAIHLARTGANVLKIRDEITSRFGYDLSRSLDDLRANYHCDETCQGAVPAALICALNACSFEDAVRNATCIGDDSETVAGLVGAVAEPLFGIPLEIHQRAWEFLTSEMRRLVRATYEQAARILPFRQPVDMMALAA